MKVNGKNILLKNKICLYDFLKTNNYNIKTVAVEINKEIIDTINYKNTFLKEDDIIEIVNFVGGG